MYSIKGGSLAKSRKLFFQGRSFLEGKIQKMKKKFSKNFIVPNCSLGHIDHLYTYKRYVEHVGFTEKRQKISKLAILSQNKAKILKFKN